MQQGSSIELIEHRHHALLLVALPGEKGGWHNQQSDTVGRGLIKAGKDDEQREGVVKKREG